jgi:hypothetical protein
MPDRPRNPTHLLYEGTIELPLGAPRGIVNATAVAASNNEMWGVRFDVGGADGAWRFNVPNLPGYSGGDVVVRVYWTSAFSGDPNEDAVWDLGYYFARAGVALVAFTNVQQTVDMETYAFDTVRYTDFAIPAASVAPTADFLCLRVMRRLGIAAVEFDNGIYVHFLKALYTGLL